MNENPIYVIDGRIRIETLHMEKGKLYPVEYRGNKYYIGLEDNKFNRIINIFREVEKR